MFPIDPLETSENQGDQKGTWRIKGLNGFRSFIQALYCCMKSFLKWFFIRLTLATRGFSLILFVFDSKWIPNKYKLIAKLVTSTKSQLEGRLK